MRPHRLLALLVTLAVAIFGKEAMAAVTVVTTTPDLAAIARHVGGELCNARQREQRMARQLVADGEGLERKIPLQRFIVGSDDGRNAGGGVHGRVSRRCLTR